MVLEIDRFNLERRRNAEGTTMPSLVKDLMTTQVVTAGPATPFKEIVARVEITPS